MCDSGVSTLIDCQTPASVFNKVGLDGRDYKLVFSDEFNEDGRTFEEGADSYWEAADMHYYATQDLEYYDPSRITTKDGHLVIELIKAPNPAGNNGQMYMSGMLSSWNKFCFTGGILEASVSLPGSADVPGLWPAFWTMGNLARPGYGATTDGLWPYSYDTCDSGTLDKQTNIKTQKTPTMMRGVTEEELSTLGGQRLSACTCKGETDHPGPSNNVGRGAPEIDVLEGIINSDGLFGEMSQSLQLAPFSAEQRIKNSTDVYMLGEDFETRPNEFVGNSYQQCISTVSKTDQKSYQLEEEDSFQMYGVEFAPSNGDNSDGYISWLQNGTKTLHVHETAFPADIDLDIGQRHVPREPMYIIEPRHLRNMEQRCRLREINPSSCHAIRLGPSGYENVDCDPPKFPTREYIEKHETIYSDSTIKGWGDYMPEGFPKNSLKDQCQSV